MKLKKQLFIITGLLCSLNIFAGDKTFLKWQTGYHKNYSDTPAKWFNSTVPGAVQLDVMVGENYKQPFWYNDNFKQFDWMEDWHFTYKTSFAKPALKDNQKVYFHSKGIDYQFDIYLNGEKILSQEGMFTYIDIDITDKLKAQNDIKIVLLPVPKTPEAREKFSNYRENANHSAKPAVSYGWDWHPRLVTSGIWDETYLDIRASQNITSASVTYELNDSLSTAKLKLNVEGNQLAGAGYKWTLKDPSGSVVLTKEGTLSANSEVIAAGLQKPTLWWPNGYGKPSLYTSEVELLYNNKSLEKKTSKVGFKRVKLIMNEGAWVEPQIFPKGRSVVPASFEVNGKRIFAKGSNWVHPDIFMGLINKEAYEKQIKLAKETNFNIFRIWGGGVTNKESFFDLCDEYGIMVWQEFPLACNNYPDDPKYLAVLEQEARSIIKRVRSHASLALWCGGNELFNNWSGMNDQSMPLRLLDKLCYELDPQTPYNPTSPLFGMAHGHYVFYDDKNGGEVLQWMANAKNTAYTEFGIPSVASADILKSFIPKADLFPPKVGTAWETHHAFYAWGEKRWLELAFLEDYFGKIKNLEDLVTYSQLIQCEGYKCIFEEARRQKPYCAMAINWCFQEPWPCAANNSLISYPNSPKPALYHIAKSCRPVLSSARAPKFRWNEGETFSCDLYMLNDSYEKIPASQVKVKLVYDDNKEITFLTWDFPGTEEFKNFTGPTARVVLPKMKNSLFKMVVEVAGKPEYKSEYTFVYNGLNVQNSKPKIQYLNGVTD